MYIISRLQHLPDEAKSVRSDQGGFSVNMFMIFARWMKMCGIMMVYQYFTLSMLKQNMERITLVFLIL